MNIDREFAKDFGRCILCNTFSLHAGTCFSFVGRHVKCRIYIEYFAPCKGVWIAESGNFWLWNLESGKFDLWNPESWIFESGIQLKEFRI